MLIINDTLGTYGGSITLIERICTWAVNNKQDIKIYCNDVSNKEIVSKLDLLGVSIACFDTYNTKKIAQHIKEDLCKGDIQIVSFILNNYLSVETVKKKNGLDFVNVIYSIHPATFYKGTGIKEGRFKKAIIRRYKKTIQKINSNAGIIFMDQDNIDSTEAYYGMRLTQKPVIRALPMICEPLNKDELERKLDFAYANKTIFTSCRADFPFKGYVFGLIDDFVELCKKYDDIKLCIVCSGDSADVALVRKKIQSTPDSVQKKIEFHNWMKYDNLLNAISKAYLYVGMGTGVLDAAIKYVPSVAVKYNTYENIAACILCDRPDYLLAEETCKSRAIWLIDELLSYDRIKYGDVSRKCFSEVQNVYDVDLFFDCIKSIEKRKSYLSTTDVFVHSMNTFLNSLKKEKHYDVNNIQYEEGE